MKDLLASFSSKVPDAIECTKLLAPVGRVAIAIEGDGKRAEGRLAIDIGTAARAVEATLLPAPRGSRRSPRRRRSPHSGTQICSRSARGSSRARRQSTPILGWLDKFGVRSARAALIALDPDQKSGSGVVALDPRAQALLRVAARRHPGALADRAQSHVRSAQGTLARGAVRRDGRLRAHRQPRTRRDRRWRCSRARSGQVRP